MTYCISATKTLWLFMGIGEPQEVEVSGEEGPDRVACEAEAD
jgi:hypothetical protein